MFVHNGFWQLLLDELIISNEQLNGENKKLQRYKSEKQSISLYENKQTNKKILKKYANWYININDDEEKIFVIIFNRWTKSHVRGIINK